MPGCVFGGGLGWLAGEMSFPRGQRWDTTYRTRRNVGETGTSRFPSGALMMKQFQSVVFWKRAQWV